MSDATSAHKQKEDNSNNHSNNNNNNGNENRETIITKEMWEIVAETCEKEYKYSLKTNPYEWETHSISGIGENAYGLILQVIVKPVPVQQSNNKTTTTSLSMICKVAPKNPARRSHMRVTEYYKREVFMYERVFPAFDGLLANSEQPNINTFNLTPKMYGYSLNEMNEFIIFEDLTGNFKQNPRTQMPTYELVACAFQTLAHFHAISLAMQAKEPKLFGALKSEVLEDNLFTPDISPVSIEFGKTYVRATRQMIEVDISAKIDENIVLQQNTLQKIEDNFKAICLRCVDGSASAPCAVICHGDFWNNNILYKRDKNESTGKEFITAKLLDFQMSRYAPPVLDVVHYLFVCTDRELRDVHYKKLVFESYYETLVNKLKLFDLLAEDIYSRQTFEQQLMDFGVYGFCMAAFSIPFFISDSSELPDLDEVSQAIEELKSSPTGQGVVSQRSNAKHYNNHSQQQVEKGQQECQSLINDFYLLNSRTIPVFKERMAGAIGHIVQFKMHNNL